MQPPHLGHLFLARKMITQGTAERGLFAHLCPGSVLSRTDSLGFFCLSRRFFCGFCCRIFLCLIFQDQILAVWILAAKLPNSDLNFTVDFGVDFFLLFSPRKKARKNPPKNPPQNPPGTLLGKIPLGFLQKPFLDIFVGEKVPSKMPQENPGKTLQSICNENPRHISAEGPGNNI